MKKLLKSFFVLLMVFLVAISLVACGDPATDTSTDGEVKYKKTITVAHDVALSSSDPQAFSNPPHKYLYILTHTPLVRYKPDTQELIPGLAERWELADDLVTWTFYLRKGVKFHNGEELKADDVIFTWERGAKTAYSTDRPHYASAIELTAVDDYTVQMKLQKPNMDYAYIISQPNYGILNRKAFEDDPEKGYNVGTGAFKLKDFVEGDYYSVERFDDFWDGPVPTEEIIVKTVTEPSAQVVALQNGELDIALYVDPIQYDIIESDPNLVLQRYTSASINHLAMNSSKEPLNNVKLRQAIAYALDTEEIIMGAANGEGVRAKSFWGLDQFGLHTEIVPYERDIEKAKALMVEAGYPNGLELEIVCFSTTYVTIAEIMQGQLKDIGINLNIKRMDFAAAREYCSLTSNQHQLYLGGFSNNPHGDDSRRTHGVDSAINYGRIDNPRVTQLFDLSQQEKDEQKRIEYYQEIQQIVHDDANVYPLYFGIKVIAHHKGLKGNWIYPGDCQNLTYAYIIEE